MRVAPQSDSWIFLIGIWGFQDAFTEGTGRRTRPDHLLGGGTLGAASQCTPPKSRENLKRISDAQSLTKPVEGTSSAPIQPYDSTPHLPSMVDLLLRECSKVLKNGGPCVKSPPTFWTGLGKSVTVKQFSIAKALSILGDIDFSAGSQDHDRDSGCGFLNSLF